MALATIKSRIATAHIFIIRDGASITSPSSGTASRTLAPDASESTWLEWGPTEMFSIEKIGETIETFAGAAGRRVRYDVLRTNQGIDISFEMKTLRPEAFEMVLGTLALTTSSTQHNPLEGAEKKVWLRAQLYDNDNALLDTIQMYGDLDYDGAMEVGPSIISPKFKFRGIHSIYNTGTL